MIPAKHDLTVKFIVFIAIVLLGIYFVGGQLGHWDYYKTPADLERESKQ